VVRRANAKQTQGGTRVTGWLGVWLLIAGVSAQAGATQAPPPRVAEVSVIVTASAPPAGSRTMDAEQLAALPGATPDEQLRAVAGFSLFRRSSSRYANPTTHGVTMRGLSASGASRGLVLLEGIPLNDGFGAWVTWTRVPSLALDRIVVTPGAAGDLFGSDALGGVIQLQSAMPSVTRGTVAVEAGSNGTYVAESAGGGRVDRLSWFGATSLVNTDGTIPLEPASIGAVDRATDARWWNGFGRLELNTTSGRWAVFGFGGRDDRGNGTVEQRNRMSGGTVAATYTTTTNTSTFSARVSMSPNTFRQSFSAVSATRATENVTNRQLIDSTTTRVVVEAGRTWTRAYALVRGAFNRASAEFSETRSTGTTTVELIDRSESVSAQAAWTGWNNVTATGGLRHEWRIAPTDAKERDRALVGRVGVDWRVRPDVSLRATTAVSHRWPTLNELARGFRVGSAVTLANPDLAPERATSVEVGAAWDGEGGRLGATVFHSVVDDAIANVTLPSLTGIVRQRRNAGDAVATGVEVDGELAVSTWARISASAVVVDATFQRSLEPTIEGKRLPQVPRVSGAVSAVVMRGPVTSGVTIKSTGHQFDDDRNTFRLAAATLVDATVSARFGRLRVFGVVENLFDARVETGRTPLVSLAPGRAARIGVSVSLGGLLR
jgi:outer membrane receptor protein involved in Fe transport